MNADVWSVAAVSVPIPPEPRATKKSALISETWRGQLAASAFICGFNILSTRHVELTPGPRRSARDGVAPVQPTRGPVGGTLAPRHQPLRDGAVAPAERLRDAAAGRPRRRDDARLHGQARAAPGGDVDVRLVLPRL